MSYRKGEYKTKDDAVAALLRFLSNYNIHIAILEENKTFNLYIEETNLEKYKSAYDLITFIKDIGKEI